MAGAVFSSTGEAQARQLPDSATADSLAKARADSLRADSLIAEDLRIIAAQRRRADSIKTPTPASEMPPRLEIGDALVWNRDQLFATGSLTLGDLLDRVPGFTVFRTGWLGSPEQGAYMGDFGQLRVFRDGIELRPLDPRNGGTLDLSFVQLWPLEEVRIERGASEVRVHLRTWRVRSVTPHTRVDVGTGDAETNGYRGYFGRRFGSGQALQVGAFQYTTRDTPGVGDADQLSLFGRVGWARGRFSSDATYLRTSRERTEQPRLRSSARSNLPPLKATFGDVYLRAAYSDTIAGLWAQLTAAQLGHDQSRQLSTSETGSEPSGVDSTAFEVSRRQFIAAAGWSQGALALSATARLHSGDASSELATVVRAAHETSRSGLGIMAEDRRETGVRRIEAIGRVLPLPYVALSGAISRTLAGDSAREPGSLSVRAELGLRLGRTWIAGGLMTRDTAALIAPVVFDSGFASLAVPRMTGTFLTVRGKVWKDVGAEIVAVKWDSTGSYRPAYQTRTQLYLDTNMRQRYPSGNLNILFAFQHEYRARASFPLVVPSGATTRPAPLQSGEFRSYGLLLEIRLINATLSYQYRNLVNARYQQVPGFQNLRAVQYYGVRWNFYN